MTQWIELPLGRNNADHVALLKQAFDAEGPRGLDWANTLEVPAVAWIEVTSGSLVLIEAEGAKSGPGRVRGRLRIAATGAVISLTNHLDTDYAGASFAEHDPENYRPLKGVMEWLVVLIAFPLNLPKPETRAHAEPRTAEDPGVY